MLSINTIAEMEKEIKGNSINLSDLVKEKTAIVVVDMVNGFVHEGILSSPRVVDIIKPIIEIDERTVGYKKIFFVDQHKEDSMEFTTYVMHCIKGTSEAELIPELKGRARQQKNISIIPKNSTNGFHAPEFKKWLQENEENIENYIVVGCEVDICVSHFATTLKTYFNEKNRQRRIIVPIDAVETYDFGTHNGDIMKIIALYEMKMNGIEIVDKIG